MECSRMGRKNVVWVLPATLCGLLTWALMVSPLAMAGPSNRQAVSDETGAAIEFGQPFSFVDANSGVQMPGLSFIFAGNESGPGTVYTGEKVVLGANGDSRVYVCENANMVLKSRLENGSYPEGAWVRLLRYPVYDSYLIKFRVGRATFVQIFPNWVLKCYGGESRPTPLRFLLTTESTSTTLPGRGAPADHLYVPRAANTAPLIKLN